MTDKQIIKNLKKELAFAQSVISRQNTEIARLTEDYNAMNIVISTLRQENKYLRRVASNRCGTCIYSKPVERPGKATIWVECTNEEHLKKYCTSYEGTKFRPKNTHACKSYKERKEE